MAQNQPFRSLEKYGEPAQSRARTGHLCYKSSLHQNDPGKVHLFMRLLVVLIGSLLLLGCQSQQPGTSAVSGQAIPAIGELLGTPTAAIPPRPTIAEDEMRVGQAVYAVHCASCHGANLEGEANWKEQNPDGSFRAPPHDETGHTWHHPDAQLIEAIRLGGTRLPTSVGGTSQMPAFEQVLTDVEILAVLAYIKSHWPDDIQAAQWEMSARSEGSQ
jgi:S-disulfanyl-L-cysteine oxidoreductase SoxD